MNKSQDYYQKALKAIRDNNLDEADSLLRCSIDADTDDEIIGYAKVQLHNIHMPISNARTKTTYGYMFFIALVYSIAMIFALAILVVGILIGFH